MSRSKNKYRHESVRVNKFSAKGHGVGVFTRSDGSQGEAEVSFAIPGDQIKAFLNNKKRGKWTGRIEEIEKASPDRITPKCKHFGVCGGCKWQQLTYEKQLSIKEMEVKKIFTDLLLPTVDFRPIIASKEEWAYRNKMEFSFSSDKEQNRYLGLNMDQGKGKVVNLTECHLVNPWFIDALEATRKWWEQSNLLAYHPLRDSGSLRTLIVREGKKTGDRLIMLTVSGNPEYALQKQHLDSFVKALKEKVEVADANLSIFLRIQQTQKGSPTNFFEMHLYGSDHLEENLTIQTSENNDNLFRFSVSPSAFFQPNTLQAETFYSLGLKMAGLKENQVVYDLYCGTGTIGICASKEVKEVIGVEISKEAVSDAEQNIKFNKRDNITIFSKDVAEMLKEMQESNKYPSADLVIVDPPRVGLDAKAISILLNMNPKKILYISCNPATQANNIKELVLGGYQLQIVQPVDQFPQTVHVENICFLTKI